MKKKKRIGEEPTIDEMLDDPLIALLMQRDGLAPGEVRAIWVAAARRLQETEHDRMAAQTVIEAA